MRKKTGIIIFAVGAALIIAALLLLAYNLREDYLAGKNAEKMLADVESGMGSAPASLSPELPSVEINGYEYVGYVEIPALELKLPVMSEWSYPRLKIAPCRQFGSSRTDDLVIAAHNYQNHFGRLKYLNPGDTVIFTDMDGVENTYAVTEVDTIDPYSVDEVQNSGHDLVLYTCTIGGKTRVTVFCDRVS